MRGSNLTQYQKIITLMAKRKDVQEWFLPSDFMKTELDYLFVGYEASARFSELAKRHPNMLESLPAGKYKKRRIRWESMDQWFGSLPKDLRYAFHRMGVTKDLKGINAKAIDRIYIDEATHISDQQIADIPRPQSEPTKLFDIPPERKRFI